MSQDLAGINKPRNPTGPSSAVGSTTYAKAVGQGTSTDSNRQFQNPHDDKNWDSYTPHTPENPEFISDNADDEPLLLSISALQAMLEDPENPSFTNPNERALWLSRLVALRAKGWSQVAWHVDEPLPNLLRRLWANAGLPDKLADK